MKKNVVIIILAVVSVFLVVTSISLKSDKKKLALEKNELESILETKNDKIDDLTAELKRAKTETLEMKKLSELWAARAYSKGYRAKSE